MEESVGRVWRCCCCGLWWVGWSIRWGHGVFGAFGLVWESFQCCHVGDVARSLSAYLQSGGDAFRTPVDLVLALAYCVSTPDVVELFVSHTPVVSHRHEYRFEAHSNRISIFGMWGSSDLGRMTCSVLVWRQSDTSVLLYSEAIFS